MKTLPLCLQASASILWKKSSNKNHMNRIEQTDKIFMLDFLDKEWKMINGFYLLWIFYWENLFKKKKKNQNFNNVKFSHYLCEKWA